jgi:hypothetical protein
VALAFCDRLHSARLPNATGKLPVLPGNREAFRAAAKRLISYRFVALTGTFNPPLRWYSLSAKLQRF